MKLNRKEVLSILAMHQNNIDKRAINPIFASIRIVSDAKTLSISSMDGERLLIHTINEQFQKCDIFLPGANLYDLLRKSKEEFFEIIESEKNESEQNYIIKLGKGEFKFAKNKDMDFPVWTDSHDFEFTFDAKEFSNSLKTVKWASSNDDSRPFLNGVCLDINDKVNFCATDGLRLALKSKNQTTANQGSWIFSKKSINDLIKLLDDSQGDMQIYLGKNVKVHLQNKSTSIVWKSLLVSGKFPQYDKIINKTYLATLNVDSQVLVDIIERMMIIANFNQPILTFSLGFICEVFAESSVSSGKDLLTCNYDGPDLRISFNGRLLLEMLNNISGNIQILINNPLSPVSIKSENNDDTVFILAPIKR